MTSSRRVVQRQRALFKIDNFSRRSKGRVVNLRKRQRVVEHLARTIESFMFKCIMVLEKYGTFKKIEKSLVKKIGGDFDNIVEHVFERDADICNFPILKIKPCKKVVFLDNGHYLSTIPLTHYFYDNEKYSQIVQHMTN